MTTTTRLNDVDIHAVGSLIDTCSANPEQAETTWSSTTRWTGGFRSESHSRDFNPSPSDEPSALGGTNTAPNPVEQLLGALGNCLTVGYLANATAAGIEIDELEIQVSGDLDLQTFLGLTEGHAGFSNITASVRLVPTDPDADIEGIHRKVVSTSPVGHTLTAPIPLKVSLATAKSGV